MENLFLRETFIFIGYNKYGKCHVHKTHVSLNKFFKVCVWGGGGGIILKKKKNPFITVVNNTALLWQKEASDIPSKYDYIE